jgi:hypothetical protein
MALKNFIALILIGGSLTFAVLLITDQRYSYNLPTGAAPEEKLAQSEPPAASDAALASLPELPIIEQINPEERQAAASNAAGELDNWTQNVGQKIAEELQQNGAVLSAGQVAQKILLNELANINPDQFKVIVPIGDLKIMAGADPKQIKDFIAQIKTGLAETMLRYSVIKDLNQIKSLVEKAVSRFYNLTVPQELAVWHADYLGMLKTLDNILAALIKADQDPLKALIAVKALDKLDLEMTNHSRKLENLANNLTL